jgi:hypothetical protein
MTRRRKHVMVSLVLFTTVGVLALPGVHWRLIGWWRGEPFWRGRPASFYARSIRSWYPHGSTLLSRTQTPSEERVRRRGVGAFVALLLVGGWLAVRRVVHSIEAEQMLHATHFTVALVERFVTEHGHWPKSWEELEATTLPWTRKSL